MTEGMYQGVVFKKLSSLKLEFYMKSKRWSEERYDLAMVYVKTQDWTLGGPKENEVMNIMHNRGIRG